MGHIWVDASFEGPKGERSMRAFVDTGATHTMISYQLADEIGLQRTKRTEKAELADGTLKEFEVAHADIAVLGRKTIGAKVYLTKGKEPSLGVITLEELGLEVDPSSEEVRPSRSWMARA